MKLWIIGNGFDLYLGLKTRVAILKSFEFEAGGRGRPPLSMLVGRDVLGAPNRRIDEVLQLSQ